MQYCTIEWLEAFAVRWFQRFGGGKGAYTQLVLQSCAEFVLSTASLGKSEESREEREF